jgi:hypothetical protein
MSLLIITDLFSNKFVTTKTFSTCSRDYRANATTTNASMQRHCGVHTNSCTCVTLTRCIKEVGTPWDTLVLDMRVFVSK